MTHQKPAGELSGGLFVFARGAMHRQLLPAADGEREFWKRPSPSRLRRATSPERERLWQRRKVCCLTAGFFLPLTGEDETYPFCQGLALRESCRRRRLRGFVLEAPLSPQATKRGASCRRRRLRGIFDRTNPLRHGYAVPPLPKGRGFGKGVKSMLYRSTCSGS